jgi:predicted amidophosphoribosyltransferase
MGWKEKEWKKDRNQKVNDDHNNMQEEMLLMQGLILCKICIMAYSLYQPICPHCSEPNKTHYPAKL